MVERVKEDYTSIKDIFNKLETNKLIIFDYHIFKLFIEGELDWDMVDVEDATDCICDPFYKKTTFKLVDKLYQDVWVDAKNVKYDECISSVVVEDEE